LKRAGTGLGEGSISAADKASISLERARSISASRAWRCWTTFSMMLAEASLEEEFLLRSESTAAWVLIVAESRNWFLVTRGFWQNFQAESLADAPAFTPRTGLPGSRVSRAKRARWRKPLKSANHFSRLFTSIFEWSTRAILSFLIALRMSIASARQMKSYWLGASR